jgi:hypothetical protein
VGVRSVLRALLYGLVAVVALAGVLATLLVARPIDWKTKTAHYGAPLWFVATDMSAYGPAPPAAREHAVPFNPLENPARLRPDRFVASYLVFAGPPAALLWLAGRWRSRRRRVSREC